MRFYKFFTLLLTVFVLTACSGGGDDDSANNNDYYNDDNNNDNNNDNNDGNDQTLSATPKFNLTGAVALVANDKVVQKTTSSTRSSRDGSPLFTYKIYQQGDQKTRGVRATEGEGATNLWAIDENGGAEPAIDSNYPVKVMYSAVNPAGDKVYLALDNGWFASDGNDYSTFIAKNNCALFEVNKADSSFKCAVEGVFLQNYDDNYYQRVSSNQKPIQFDQDGNVYFLATTFNVQSSGGWCEGQNWDAITTGTAEEYDDQGNTVGCTAEAEDAGFVYYDNVWIDGGSDWRPRLYKYNPTTETSETLTQDNEGIEYFTALSSGDIVIQGWNDSTQKQTFAVLKTIGSRISLLESDWGLEFFATDSESTVVFSDWSNTSGLRMAKPVGAGVQKTVLGLDKFAVNSGGSYTNPTPRRVILADDGNLYGVFESWNSFMDKNNQWVSNTTLSVYQVLPYDPVPKAQLTLGDNDWWTFMEGTPFQISKGFLFYRLQEKNIVSGNVSLGSADTIVMVDLQTREKKQLLLPTSDTDPRYEMYSWQLSGTELYFSALNNTVNKVVTGKIDTLKVRLDAAESDYLTVNETASAVDATAKIQDIAVLKPTRPESDPGSYSKATFYANGENPNSVSIEFSKYMDNQAVLNNLTFQDGASSDVAYIPLWIYKTLHLIPDTDGVTNSTGSGLLSNQTYTVTLASSINDYYGFPIDNSNLSISVTTSPTTGWFIGDTDSTVSALTSGKVAKFAGRSNPNTWGFEYYLLHNSVPVNFELTFSAKNLNYSLGTIALQSNASPWLENSIDSWSSWIEFQNNQGWWDWLGYDSNGQAVPYANGNWANYRVRIWGNNYEFAVSQDGTNYDVIHSVSTLDPSRTGGDSLYLSVNEKIYLDNLKLTTLNSDGSVASISGDLIDRNFDADTDTTTLTSNPNLNTSTTPTHSIF